jgi:DNA-binding NarL/FixJ family response regulator
MVFIVDDSKAVRERLVNTLSEIDGMNAVGEARNAAEALEGIRKLQPEVVILDIQMPGGSGIEVLRAIKQESRAPVVLMLTNHSYPQYREKCMELGADYFLDKIRDFDSLTEILKSLVERFKQAEQTGQNIS